MPYPTKEIRVGLDDFFGPFMEKKLRIISVKIADELIAEFRIRLLDAIKTEIENTHVRKLEDDKQLKVIVEDKRA